MLAPERLHELGLFVAEADVEAVAAALVTARVLHLEPREGDGWTVSPRWAELGEAYQALDARLALVAEALPATATEDLEIGADEAVLPARDRAALEAEATELADRAGGWLDDLHRARTSAATWERTLGQLQELGPVTVPLEALRALEHHHVAIGTLPREHLERVAAALFQVPFTLLPLAPRGDRTLTLVAVARDDGPVLDRALAAAFFETLALPDGVGGTPAAALDTVAERLREARDTLATMEQRGAALALELAAPVAAARRRLHRAITVCDVLRRLPRQDGVYVIAGWLPADRTDATRETVLAVATSPVVMEALPPALGRRDVPTLLRNPAWLQPFEGLVSTYGLAGYDELDPTPITAATFLLMFGMMFGDLGHGALLALVGLALRRRTPYGTVVAAAGVAATGFGALYGVAFGMSVMRPLWLQPLHDIVPILVAAVAAGALVLNLGFVLNLVSAWRARDRGRFWLDKSGVLGIAFYWALLGGGLAVATGRLGAGPWLVLVLPLALATWFREPLAELLGGGRAHVGRHALTGAFELFETVVAYLSNSLSFVRLGAFAVAHEGLSSMLLRYSAGPGGVVVLVLGTALIVGFEGLIVGIQALRLQYYEFFGRFFAGRGRPFVPLAFASVPQRPAPRVRRTARGGPDALAPNP